MAGSMIDRMLRPIQQAARRFLNLPEDGGFTGTHGCLHTGASFTTWNEVEGDYLEFGVFQGESFAEAYKSIQKTRGEQESFGNQASFSGTPEYQKWKQNRPRFFAFDSFQGLPGGSATRHVDYAPGAYYCDQDQFKRNIARLGVDLKDVVTVPGYYNESLTDDVKEKYGLRHAALVMVDCDLYESTVPVLDFLTNLVGQGTVLIFHDWFRFRGNPMCGQQRACHEWLERNPHIELVEYWREGPQAISFLVNLSGRPLSLSARSDSRHASPVASD